MNDNSHMNKEILLIKGKNKLNKNAKYSNFKFLFFFLTSLILSIIILFIIIKDFQKLKANSPNIKELIVFDFDKTITQKDTYIEQRFLFKDKKTQEEFLNKIKKCTNWTQHLNDFYQQVKDANFTIKDINKILDTIQLNNGFIDLLTYLHEQNDKYEIIISSGGHSYQINYLLNKYNISDKFDDILCKTSYVDREGKIVVEHSYEHNCSICDVGQCKSFEVNRYINKMKNTKNIIFSKIYFICDGINDYCLARHLSENDLLIVKKDNELYNYIFNEKKNHNLTCKIAIWKNAYDLYDYF